MNTRELKNELLKITSGYEKYTADIMNDIINIIIIHYNNTINYYETDAINTLNGFINNGCLIW